MLCLLDFIDIALFHDPIWSAFRILILLSSWVNKTEKPQMSLFNRLRETYLKLTTPLTVNN